MSKFYAFVLLFVSSLTSYNLLADDFLIKSGSHDVSGVKIKIFNGTKFEFKAMFNESAKYSLNDIDQLDTNKLYGTSDCGNRHQENSIRIGWRWNKSKSMVEIMGYSHVHGQFQYQYIGDAQINRSFNYIIELSTDKTRYELTFNNKKISMERGCTDNSMSGYKLYPYFGGNNPAPHDISIKVSDPTDEFANFSVGLLYPNPTKESFVFYNMKIEEDLEIGFNVFDMMGRLIVKTDTANYSKGTELEKQKLSLPEDIASGVYLVQPFAMIDGEEKYGFVATPGNALKLMIIK